MQINIARELESMSRSAVFYATQENVEVLSSPIDCAAESTILTTGELMNRTHGYDKFLPATFADMRNYMKFKWGYVGSGELVRVLFFERTSKAEEILPLSMLARY